MPKSVRSNVWKLSAITALRWSMLAMPIMVLFLQDNGLSMQQIFTLQALFSAAVVVFEVPSGYFADKVGRKNSIILGTICGFAGYVVYSISNNFGSFLIAEIWLALAASFISGADSAMLYDSLDELGETKSYKKYQGYVFSITRFSEGLAAIAGGFLAVASLRMPFVFQAGLNLLAVPLAMSLIETKRMNPDKSEWNAKGIIDVLKFALHGHPQVKWLIIYSSVVSASTFTVVWFIQPFLKNAGLELALFGLAWAILQLTVTVSSLFAYKIESFLGRKVSLVSLIFLSAAGYFLLARFDALWAASFILIFYFVWGLSSPVFQDYVNQLTPSEIRATVLSVQSLGMRILFVVIGPLVGWISDVYSMKQAFMISGALFLILGIFSIIFLGRHKVFNSQAA